MTGRVFKISADIVWHVPWMLPCYHPIEHKNFLETTKYLESMHIYIYISIYIGSNPPTQKQSTPGLFPFLVANPYKPSFFYCYWV